MASVVADSQGFYQLSLLPGLYSIGLIDSVRIYMNLINDNGILNSLAIGRGRTEEDLFISYDAQY
jgi:hypothetical protein